VTHAVGLSSPAIRSLDALPPRVAAAVVAFVFGTLSDIPHQAGKPLRGRLTGLHSARRGDYRVLYEIDDDAMTVTVVRVAHRTHAYRP
jgi:mRNA interferase RelE/StbE